MVVDAGGGGFSHGMAAKASHSQAQMRDVDLLDAGCDYAPAPFRGKAKAKAFPAVPIPAN